MDWMRCRLKKRSSNSCYVSNSFSSLGFFRRDSVAGGDFAST